MRKIQILLTDEDFSLIKAISLHKGVSERLFVRRLVEVYLDRQREQNQKSQSLVELEQQEKEVRLRLKRVRDEMIERELERLTNEQN